MAQWIKDYLAELDHPIELEEKTNIFKWGTFKVGIIYEDLSIKFYHIKLKNTYKFTIKGRDYIVIPRAILRGKNPTSFYYFNNPFPIFFEYEKSELSSLDLYTDGEKAKVPENLKELLGKTKIDSETLNNLLTTNIVKGLYPKAGFTGKFVIIILVVVFVIIMVILQVTGLVDITSFFRAGG